MATTRGSPRHYDPATLRRTTAGAVLPALPPHSSSPRARGDAKMASFLMQPREAAGGWLHCLRGGNTLPAADRVCAQAEESSPLSPKRQLGAMSKCSKQLTEFLTRLIDVGATARDGTAVFCAITADGVGAEQVALVPASLLGMDACLSDSAFTRACEATIAAAPSCERLVASLERELLQAAMSRVTLNMFGDDRGGMSDEPRTRPVTPPRAAEVGRVVIRDPPPAGGVAVRQETPQIRSAMVIPVADPATRSTVALLVCCNSLAGRFGTAEELFCECAALHIGLLWLHHVQVLRLRPLPSAPLSAPDVAASQLRARWQALTSACEAQRNLLAEGWSGIARVGGGGSIAPPVEAVGLACRRVLRARAGELRRALLATASAAARNVAEAECQQLAADWSTVVLAELVGEAERLGGPAALEHVTSVMDGPLQEAAAQAAQVAAKRLPRLGRPELPTVAIRADAAPTELLRGFEACVILPAFRAGAPALASLCGAVEEILTGLRGKIGGALLEQATWVGHETCSTAELIDGDLPPRLTPWLADLHASAWTATLEGARAAMGDGALTQGATDALRELLSLQVGLLRTEVGEQIRGAALLCNSVLEIEFWTIAEWLEGSLNGRLQCREAILDGLRAVSPRWVRQLLAAVVTSSAPVSRRFESRAHALDACASGEPPGEPTDMPAPDHARAAVARAADVVATELTHEAMRLMEPLQEHHPAAVARTRPLVVQRRIPLRSALIATLTAAVCQPTHVLHACRAMRCATDSVQRAVFVLMPELTPPRDDKDQPVLSSQLPRVIQQAVKQSLLCDMPSLVVRCSTILSALEKDSSRLALELRQTFAKWGEKCYTALLGALADVIGAESSELAMHHLADLVPAAAELIVKNLQQDSRLSHLRDTSLLQRVLEAEADVLRQIAAPHVRKHSCSLVTNFTGHLGDALRNEIDAITAAEAADAAQKAGASGGAGNKGSRSNRVSREARLSTEDGDQAPAAAREVAAYVAEERRRRWYEFVARVFAPPVLSLLEESLQDALYGGDWHYPPSLSANLGAATRAWAAAVHARIDRDFLSTRKSTEHELRLLKFVQGVLVGEDARVGAWLGEPSMSVAQQPLIDIRLLVTIERLLGNLIHVMGDGPGYILSPALSVLLHIDPGERPPPMLDFLNGSAPAHAAIEIGSADSRDWALRQPAEICLFDDVVAALEPPRCSSLEKDMARRMVGAEARVEAEHPHASGADESASNSALLPSFMSEPAAPPRVLAHLVRTLWALNETERPMPDLMRLLVSSIAPCIEDDRLFEACIYCKMTAAPLMHMSATAGSGDVGNVGVHVHAAANCMGLDDEMDRLWRMRVDGSSVEDEQAVHLLACPLAVQIALRDGSRVEEILAELPVLTSARRKLSPGTTHPKTKASTDMGRSAAEGDATPSPSQLISCSRRLFLPLRKASCTHAVGVLEVVFAEGVQPTQLERLILARLVSAFGAAAIRQDRELHHTSTCARMEAEGARLRGELTGLQRRSEQHTTLLSVQASLRLASQDAPPTLSELPAVAKSLRALTKAKMVTIFSTSVRAAEGDYPSLIVQYNDFGELSGASALKHNAPSATTAGVSRRRRRSSDGGAAASRLPHPGFARHVLQTRSALNCSTPYQQAKALFDGTAEHALGFCTECALTLPIIHAGVVLGIVQLTNKEDEESRHLEANATNGNMCDAKHDPSEGWRVRAFEVGGAGYRAAESQDDGLTACERLFGRGTSRPKKAANDGGLGDAQSRVGPESLPVGPHFTPDDEAAAYTLLGGIALLLLSWRQMQEQEAAAQPMDCAAAGRTIGAGFNTSATAVFSARASLPNARPPAPRCPPACSCSLASAVEAPRLATPQASDGVHVALQGPALELLRDIAADISSAKSTRALLLLSLETIETLVTVEDTAIFMTGEDDGSMLRVSLSHNEFNDAKLVINRVADVDRGVVGSVLTGEEAICINDTTKDRRFDPSVDGAPGSVVRAVLCEPIMGARGVLGAIELCNPESSDTFTTMHRSTLGLVSSLLAPALERRLLLDGFERRS